MSSLTSDLIRVKNLDHGPLHQLTFSWGAGVHAVCGDEGTGKTTLLRLLAGDVQPSQGIVLGPEGDVFWVDLQGAEHDAVTVQACWTRCACVTPNGTRRCCITWPTNST